MRRNLLIILLVLMVIGLCSCQNDNKEQISELENRIEELEKEVYTTEETVSISQTETTISQTIDQTIEKEIILGEPIELVKGEDEIVICFNSVQYIKGKSQIPSLLGGYKSFDTTFKQNLGLQFGGLDYNDGKYYLVFEGHVKNNSANSVSNNTLLDKNEVKQNGNHNDYFNICFNNKYNFGLKFFGVNGDDIYTYYVDLSLNLFDEIDFVLYTEVPKEVKDTPYKMTFISNGVTYYYQASQTETLEPVPKLSEGHKYIVNSDGVNVRLYEDYTSKYTQVNKGFVIEEGYEVFNTEYTMFDMDGKKVIIKTDFLDLIE